MIHTLAVAGYRTLRDLVLPLGRLTLVTGANGSGKSSLYRSVRLLADIAQGRIISSLAAEGGLQSTLWAGPERISRAMRTGEIPIQGTVRSGPVSLRLGFASDDFGYSIELGLPILARTAFGRDPEIKVESVWVGPKWRNSNVFASRKGPHVALRGANGKTQSAINGLAPYDSMMTHAADPRTAPELIMLRERMRAWRFYDHIPTDRDAPARRPQVGTRTVSLAPDGADLAAAIQTIFEIGDARAFEAAIADAFPGSTVTVNADDMFALEMSQAGLLRPLRAAELSDGTLRYIAIVAALLTPRPAPLIVLNEPETSLHPDLLAPLARLMVEACSQSQLIVVSHAPALIEALTRIDTATHHILKKDVGETMVDAVPPSWEWPTRK